jgi:hypothetical protein
MTQQASRALLDALEITPADLEANRAGELGTNQQDRLLSLRQRTVLIGSIGFFGFVLLATTLLYFGQVNQQFMLTALGIFTTMINALFGGIYGQQFMRFSRDIRNADVEVLEGNLERILKADNRFNNYAVRIEDTEFYLNKEQFLLFKHEAPYRFYRAPYSKILLAAEPL